MQINDIIADMKNLSTYIQSEHKFETKVASSIHKINNYIYSIEQKNIVDANVIHHSIERLMKLSFDQQQRNLLVQVGGLRALSNLLHVECQYVGVSTINEQNILIRRYCCMALTNLTYGDPAIKYWLCCDDLKHTLPSLLALLKSPNDELRQAVACVLRNLCWKVDPASKLALQESECIKSLLLTAMSEKKDSTLKVMLAALWNVSAHSRQNKKQICELKGSLEFLVKSLSHMNCVVVENGGGILRNISSQIALNNTYRTILRDNNALSILCCQLNSANDVIIGNACGTLWNISARCQQDQRTLINLKIKSILSKLSNSNQKMISKSATAILKNLSKIENEISNVKANRLQPFSEQQDCVVSFKTEGTPPLTRSHSLNMLSHSCNQTVESDEAPKTFQVEDTPVIISRNSSLSSLQPVDDQSKKSVVIQKSVSFQPTPLMYSRTSSPESLNNEIDMNSCHSDVISDYSTRQSEVVSPTDLPDSPTDVLTQTNIISVHPDTTVKRHSLSDDEEKPKRYAIEDVECTESHSGLSSITIDSTPMHDTRIQLSHLLNDTISCQNKEIKDNASDSSYSGDEDVDEEELLKEIIRSALPPESDKEDLFKKPMGLPPKPKARRNLNGQL